MNNQVARYPHSGKEKYQLVSIQREIPQQLCQVVDVIPHQKEKKILFWLMLINKLVFVKVMNGSILREHLLKYDVDGRIQRYNREEKIKFKTCHEEIQILV